MIFKVSKRLIVRIIICYNSVCSKKKYYWILKLLETIIYNKYFKFVVIFKSYKFKHINLEKNKNFL